MRSFDPSGLDPKARKAFLRLNHFLTDILGSSGNWPGNHASIWRRVWPTAMPKTSPFNRASTPTSSDATLIGV